MLNEIPGVRCPEPDGAFYAFPNLDGLIGRPLGRSASVASTSLELAALVLEEARVAFVPGEAFGASGYGRFSYALSDDALAGSASGSIATSCVMPRVPSSRTVPGGGRSSWL